MPSQSGGGDQSEDQARAPRRIAHEPEPALWCPDPVREPMPVAGGRAGDGVGCTVGPRAAEPKPVTGMRSSTAATRESWLEFRRMVRELAREARELVEIV